MSTTQSVPEDLIIHYSYSAEESASFIDKEGTVEEKMSRNFGRILELFQCLLQI